MTRESAMEKALTHFFTAGEAASAIEVKKGNDIEQKYLVTAKSGKKYLLKTTCNPCFSDVKRGCLGRFTGDFVNLPVEVFESEGIKVCLYPWIEGETVMLAMKGDVASYAKRCAAMLRNLHSIRKEKPPELNLLEEYDSLRRFCTEHALKFPHQSFFSAYFERHILEFDRRAEEIALVHGDFKPENIMCAHDRLYLIDIENILFADPWTEFIKFTLRSSPLKEAFFHWLMRAYFQYDIPGDFLNYLSCMSVLALYRNAKWDYNHKVGTGRVIMQAAYLYEHYDFERDAVRTWFHLMSEGGERL